MLLAEVEQVCDEGTPIPNEILKRITSLDPVEDAWNFKAVDKIWDDLDALPRNHELAEAEPNDLPEIRKLTGKTTTSDIKRLDLGELQQCIEGAWRGRMAGCALGLPYERLGCTIHDGKNIGIKLVQNHLRETLNFPMTDFAKTLPDPSIPWGVNSLSSSINHMEPDDDIHFTVANLCVYEKHGSEFTWNDIADWWLSNLAMTEFCTAEVQALLNYASMTARWGSDGGPRSVATPDYTRRFRNPYREWIGAQIRSDFWGWVSPLDPYQATEFAFRDASWTHERNGIYGAMFFSAMQSLAFGQSSIESLICEALTFIPPKSRLAQTIVTTVEISQVHTKWDDAHSILFDTLNETRTRHMSPVHTINNAAICVLALLFGNEDPFHAARLAVMSGLDTDCNAATVGAVLGVMHGSDICSDQLVARLGDKVSTRIASSQDLVIPNLVDRTVASIVKNSKSKIS